jgi:shikimate kinase
MIVLAMGASGVGKTTIGQALAAQLGWRFVCQKVEERHPQTMQ